MADVVVRGELDVGTTESDIVMSVSCVNGVPVGSVSGELELIINGVKAEFDFSSTRPTSLATFRRTNLVSVGATFSNVTVHREGDGTIFGATLIMDATRVTSTSWVGQIVIVYPDGRIRRVYGLFGGSISVARSVICRR